MSKTPALVSSNWNRAYNDGKYDQEGPIPFLKEILEYLKKEKLNDGLGFYPGCGNGRNLVPLLEKGLNIKANDISKVAVDKLKSRFPKANASVGDFLTLDSVKQYDYLLSIQLFQHVNEHGPETLFEKVDQLLKPKGLFILRVNSIHTQIVQDYSIVSKSEQGGFTIKYKSGQKDGQHIHFYSAEEIHSLTNKYEVLMPLREEFIPRDDGTYWVQWETILKKS